MALGSAGNLSFLVVAAGLGLGFVWLAVWSRRASVRFAGPRAAGRPGAAYWLRAALVVGAAGLAVVAMARPQWGAHELRRQQQGVDLVVALDVSESMLAQDVAPSRLGAAQAEVRRLLQDLRGDRVGLVFFAGSAVLRSPLSSDMAGLASIVDRADKEPGLTRAGSDLGAALDQAGRILDASDSPGKAVLVVSDGEDFAGGFSAKAAELAQKGIVIFTAGVGTPQGSVILEPAGSGGQTKVKLDASGQPVITRLNEAALQAAATTGHGRYVRIQGQGGSLASLAGELDRLQQTPLGEQVQRIPVERLQVFVAAALALLALAWLVPDRLPRLRPARLPRLSPRPGLPLLVVLALLAGACSASQDSVRARNSQANRLYAAGDYQGALDAYQKLLAERPDLPELAYNTGNALDRLGQYERAIDETRRALPPPSPALGAATYFALGNHFLALNDLESAYEAYRNALLEDPGDADAKYNLELVLLRMNSQQAPPTQGQPQPGQPQDGGDQPGQDSGQPGGDQPGANPGQTGAQGSPAQAPNDQGQTDRQPSAADVQRSLQEALRGIDQDFSFEDAVRVLQLLEQMHQTRQPAAGPGTSSGPDY